jgi:phosphohistidine phosphatase
MELYLLRHGEATAREPGVVDSERRLTPEGIAQVRCVAARLASAGVRPACIYSSPLPRALETAQLVAEALGMPDAVVVTERLAGCSPGDAQAVIGDRKEDVMLVGHNPDFELLIRWLTGARCALKKAGVARIRADVIEPGAGELRWLLSPGILGA